MIFIELDGLQNRKHYFYDQNDLVQIHSCKWLHRDNELERIHPVNQCNRCVCCHHRNSTENAMSSDAPMKIEQACKQKKDGIDWDLTINHYNELNFVQQKKKKTLTIRV